MESKGYNIIKMYNDGSLLQKHNMVRLGEALIGNRIRHRRIIDEMTAGNTCRFHE